MMKAMNTWSPLQFHPQYGVEGIDRLKGLFHGNEFTSNELEKKESKQSGRVVSEFSDFKSATLSTNKFNKPYQTPKEPAFSEV